MKRIALAAAVLAAALAPGAGAHFGAGTGNLGYRSRILAVEPPMSGLRLAILYGDDQIWLDNRSGKTIVIRGYAGEPYLRFGPNGVEINSNSPAVYLNQDRFARTPVPKSASPKARPDWQRLTHGGTWAWHDHRIHYMSATPPKPIRDAPRRPHHLFDWKVAATANGKRFFITGTLDYRPPPLAKEDGFPVRLAIGLALVIAGGLAGLFALRRVLLRSLE